MPESGIYKIENQINGRLYIGSAINIKKRWQYHVQDLSKIKHKNTHLQNAWNKYGSENFKFEVLEYCNPADLIHREQYYFDSTGVCENGYNICQVAGSRFGLRLSEEAKKKMAFAITGRIVSKETREKISAGNLGKIMSEEARQKISIGNKGKIRTPEMRARSSALRMGHALPEEHKTNLRIARNKRGPFSEETKRKLSIAMTGNKNNTGKKRSEETKRRLSGNRITSPETRMKLSIATTKQWERVRNNKAKELI